MHPSEVSVVFMVESPLTWLYDVATFLILQHCKCKLHRGFWHHALSKVCLLWTKHFNPGLQTLCSWRGRWWQRDRWLDILAACQLRTDDVLGGWVEESVDQDNCSQLRSSDLKKEKEKDAQASIWIHITWHTWLAPVCSSHVLLLHLSHRNKHQIIK